MKQSCPQCYLYIELDETKYEPGTQQIVVCQRCESEVEFTIPEKKKETVKPAPSAPPMPVVPQPVAAPKPQEDPVQQPVVDRKEEVTPPIQPVYQPSYVQEEGGSNKTLIGIVIALILLAGGVGGYFYYSNIYLPEKIDREAPRYFTLAQITNLRSSMVAGADYNKVASLNYGTQLITYSHDAEWSKVKVDMGGETKLEGYIASSYLLTKRDFHILNSVFGDTDSKETVLTAKCRLAVLQYFLEKKYIGKIPVEILTEIYPGFVPDDSNQWQIFSKPAQSKPNSVYYARLVNPQSKFTDFAVIITNIQTQQRRVLLFTFDDDETPHHILELDAPSSGYIRKMYTYKDHYGDTRVAIDYSN